MAVCGYCGESFLFGGVTYKGRRFCNNECMERGALLDIAEQLPPGQVDEFVRFVHAGACPQCGGAGPVEVHTAYRVWSIVLMTSWSNHPRICCKKCATRTQLGATAFSLLFGWWGFPWGFIMTPVQIGRNIAGMLKRTEPGVPSAQFRKLMKLHLAAKIVEQEQSRAAAAQAPDTARLERAAAAAGR